MSDQNLRHWAALSKTDPKHTKPFSRAGGFRGTATRPIWTEMRLTEHFGPCGVGWGCDAPEFSLVPAGDETLVFCTLRCWYMDGETRAPLYGVGGDKVYFKDKNGFHADDEAYKKAFTDALGNAFKHVGSGADIHMGLFEDSKYKAEIAAEFAEEGAGKPAQQRSPASLLQPPKGVTDPQVPTSAPVLPVNPEEPPEVTEQRRVARSAFWSRDDYGIDPTVISGGIGAWDQEMLAMARAAPNLDAYTKLREDNRPFFLAWSGHVAKPVIDNLNRQLGAAYRKLLDAEERAA